MHLLATNTEPLPIINSPLLTDHVGAVLVTFALVMLLVSLAAVAVRTYTSRQKRQSHHATADTTNQRPTNSKRNTSR